MFKIAKSLAQRSLSESTGKPRHFHGAVLCSGGSVISYAFNRSKFNSVADRFYPKQVGNGTVHAEIGCIIRARDPSHSTIYVARVNRSGSLLYSRPCNMCIEVMRHFGVRRCLYTIDDCCFGVMDTR